MKHCPAKYLSWGEGSCPLNATSPQIDGQKYRGFGSSKQLAKQAAAEAALISFVKPPVTTAENQEEDKTPWATLASFAIYKLFNDWREGRVGMCPPPSQPYGAAIPPGEDCACEEGRECGKAAGIGLKLLLIVFVLILLMICWNIDFEDFIAF